MVILIFLALLLTPLSFTKDDLKVPVYNPKQFLQKIMQIESSGGTNFNHPEVQSGLQAGTGAMGRYGLMPNTVKEVINRRRLAKTMTPQLQDLDNMEPDKMKEYIETNPEVEDDLATTLATKVLRTQQGDEDRAAYSWNQGHNLTPDRISDDALDKSPYVQKFKRVSDILKTASN